MVEQHIENLSGQGSLQVRKIFESEDFH